jgi:hypothetical protein
MLTFTVSRNRHSCALDSALRRLILSCNISSQRIVCPRSGGRMGKRVITAANLDGAPPVFFAGYDDHGDIWTCRWTDRRTHARWFDPLEAEIELVLLRPHLTEQRWVLLPTPLEG